ncbi:hypothetical protein [Spectribacter hydrogenoxidans]|uniref:Secreted protein n=1 Tax=Spectribacter hydrogenoxidans TaxID=3075608 RepID=A0ABU3BYU4_9GAMM|nr:hypothetical protein [Salinisphaera sp. W335]MDT0634485.1 hypothetical protein [Salinisphaera sp. W335]
MQTLSKIRNLFFAMMAMVTMAFAGTAAADATSGSTAVQDQPQAAQAAYKAGGGDDQDGDDDWNQTGGGDDGEDDDGGGDW